MTEPAEPVNVGAESVEATAAAPSRSGFSLRALLMSAAIWLLYVPYLGFLRVAGPRVAVRIARLTAWLHWLLTFVGAQRAAHRAIVQNLDQFETQLPARTILRKYLEGKHHHFVVWHLSTTQRGRDFVENTLRQFEGGELIEAARQEHRGLIVMGYHFGTGRMPSLALARRYGADAYEIAFRPETYGRDALPRAAQMAWKIATETDEKSGLNHIYMNPSAAPISVIRHLRKGHIVGMAGDGFFATQFVEVPFLGGTMRFPMGVARLAAMTKAPIMLIFGLLDGIEAHRVTLHPTIHCEGDSPEQLEDCVRKCCLLLEHYVRRNPWAWWIWHRLEFSQHDDGRTRMSASAAPLHATAAAAEPS
jgi:lauroyl/myristoyl acyltransferase